MKDDIDLKLAESELDIAAAIELEHLVIGSRGTVAEKILLWSRYPKFLKRDIVMMTCKQSCIGVVRIVPQIFLFSGQRYKSAGISAVSIHPDYRGMGLSKILMDYAINEITDRKFDFSHLIARRAVDHYYNKFDFFGASSYQKIVIAKQSGIPASDLRLAEGVSEQDLGVFQESYRYSYEFVNGRCHRNWDLWLHILFRKNYLDCSIRAIKSVCGNTIGYVVLKENTIYELGLLEEYYDTKPVYKLISLLSFSDGWFLPFKHRLTCFLRYYDVQFISRECYFGGHMLRLNFIEVSGKTTLERYESFRSLVEFDIGLECVSGGFQISILDQY